MKTLVIAPHPDDELFGCGGLLLKRKNEGATLGWVIMTCISEDFGWSKDSVLKRESEIQKVSERLGVKAEHLVQFNFPTTRLDTIPMSELVSVVADVLKNFQPEEVFIPHIGDVHSDHRVTFDVAAACTKSFRYPSVKRVMSYETLSETEFSLDSQQGFRPNVFVDISLYLKQKLEMLKIYSSELEEFPFPRSEQNTKALAEYRGATAGVEAAEAFVCLREII